MIHLTLIARQQDGLPLAASVQEEERTVRNMVDYQLQAKQLFKKFARDPNPPPRCSLAADDYIYHVVVERGVCCLALCDQSFSRRLAFEYLQDLTTRFSAQFPSDRVRSASRPYCFIEFDTYIQKQRKSYMDSRARRTLTHINSELHSMQNIMVHNINDVLRRGETVSDLLNKAEDLSKLSKKYKRDASDIFIKAAVPKIMVGLLIVVVVCVAVVFIMYK